VGTACHSRLTAQSVALIVKRRAEAAGQDPQAPVAVVTRARCARPAPALAGLCAEVRPGAHLQILQADAELDHAPGAASGAGRPVDLAGAAGLHPAAPGPSHRGRPAAPASGADAGAGAPGVSGTPGLGGHTGQCAKTLWPLARTAAGSAFWTGTTLPGSQEERLRPGPPLRPAQNQPIPPPSDGFLCLKRKLRGAATSLASRWVAAIVGCGEPSAMPSTSITNSLGNRRRRRSLWPRRASATTRPRGSRQASAARSEAAHRRGAPPRQAARLPRRAGRSPASGARHRRGRVRQARNVVGRPRIHQTASGVLLTDRVQRGYLSGSGPARAGSRRTRPFHVRGSAAHPGSAG